MSRVSVRARVAGLILDDETQLAHAAGRFRPAPLVEQRVQVRLVVEARHRVVGLRLEPRAGDAAGGQRLEHRQAAAVEEVVDERREEHRLAGTG